jgi:alpha-tubulin suppressor-like RCC1 family protein
MSAAISADQRLLALLSTWYELLQQWSIDGRLKAAAKEALLLSDEPEQLKALNEEWAAGDFSGLPPIVMLPATSMPGAAGAYAISTGTIYINQDWLQSASSDAAMAVLTEELGHHLDALLNSSDTPGDEGVYFAALLRDQHLTAERIARHRNMDDNGLLWVNGQVLKVEYAYQAVSTPIRQTIPGRTSHEIRNANAFAALKADGSVITWGFFSSTATTIAPAAQLRFGVIQIFSNSVAFAALKADGSVITWGESFSGGDSSTVANRLRSGVIQIFSSENAFAALKNDGSLVTWGSTTGGGNSSAVESQLSSGVLKVFSNSSSFAALKTDGSVITWGDATGGGNSSNVSSSLRSGVTQIFSTRHSFAALKDDGSVITWGAGGGNSSIVSGQLRSGVVDIFSSGSAFAALKDDGSVVTWGWDGGNSSGVANQLRSGVSQIISTGSAFAALKTDGSVVTWGNEQFGGFSGSVASQLRSGVSKIFSTDGAFAALKTNGSVVTWGFDTAGGNSSAVARQLGSGVSHIVSNSVSFAALKNDGSVVPWGMYSFLAPSVADRLGSGVSQIFSSNTAFAALKADGSVVVWGVGSSGDSSGIASQLSDVIGFANPFTDDKLVTNTHPVPTITITPLSADNPEGNADTTNFTFRVTRSGDLSAESTARWSVAGSGVNPANQADFAAAVLPSGTVTLLAGENARTITVRVAGDTTFEADETFTVTLSNPTGATITTASATGTIRNDDTPPFPDLAIVATDADKPEGSSGKTSFTFTVTRSGDTAIASSASWAASGIGANPADAADFARGVLPSGTVRFSAGQTSRTITVNVRADRDQEPDERFRVTLSNPPGATITTASATGIIRNDDLIGTAANDTIIGTRRPEFIDGLAGQDTLTGGAGPDVFGFRFGQSRIRTPDRITDYRFGEDTIALLNAQGQLRPAPVVFSRAANNSTAATLADLAAAVFADADGRTAGDQPLAANAAALVRSTNAAIAGTYLLINDANAGRSLTADLMVNITGFSGTLPALGVRPVGTVFG